MVLPISDYFESPKILVGRAKLRTTELEKRIHNFISEKPYATVVEPDPDGMIAHKIRMTASVPAEARADAFEIGAALRSSLDQAVYAASVMVNGKAKITKFPFGDRSEDVENDIGRGCKDVPPDIVGLLRSFKPYYGGNDALWALNKMRNAKAHQILASMVFVTGQSSIGFNNLAIGGSGNAELGMARWNAEKQELTYMRLAPTRTLTGEYNVSVAVSVALNDVPVLSEKPAPRAFRELCGMVEGIVGTLEAESIRLTRG